MLEEAAPAAGTTTISPLAGVAPPPAASCPPAPAADSGAAGPSGCSLPAASSGLAGSRMITSSPRWGPEPASGPAASSTLVGSTMMTSSPRWGPEPASWLAGVGPVEAGGGGPEPASGAAGGRSVGAGRAEDAAPGAFANLIATLQRGQDSGAWQGEKQKEEGRARQAIQEHKFRAGCRLWPQSPRNSGATPSGCARAHPPEEKARKSRKRE